MMDKQVMSEAGDVRRRRIGFFCCQEDQLLLFFFKGSAGEL